MICVSGKSESDDAEQDAVTEVQLGYVPSRGRSDMTRSAVKTERITF